jgi:hypothetical protein
VLSDYGPSLRKLEKIATENEVKWVCSGHTDAFRDASIISEMAELVEGIAGGKHAPPPAQDEAPIGRDDRRLPGHKISVWIAESARR